MKQSYRLSAFLLALTGLASCAISQTQANDSPAPVVKQAQQAQQPASQPACTLVENGFGSSGQVPIKVEEVVTGLSVPWSIAFLPDRDMLVSERAGQVRLVQNGQLRPEPIATVEVSDRAEDGLLGLAVHPDFANNRFFYVYFTAEDNGSPVNRVERWRLAPDKLSASRDRVIIDNIPVAQFHNGGRIRFGPDNMLYVGTGDARVPESSQDVNSLAGKILRLTPDGEIPTDNPFQNNPAFITGIRNTQGFDWINPSTLWVSDHGPSGELGRSGHDEVSVAKAGDNLGWPTIYGCETQSTSVAPAIVWRQALPPGGAAIYTGNAIPEWKGSLIVAGLRAEQLQRVVIDPQTNRVQKYEVYLEGQQGRLREAIMSPDGDLYVTTSNCDGRGNCPPEGDKILRITAP
jgi:aldose sugar dehydrogenase